MSSSRDVLHALDRLRADVSEVELNAGIGLGRGDWSTTHLARRRERLAAALDGCDVLTASLDELTYVLAGALRQLDEEGGVT